MIRATQIFFWFGLSIAASIALYHTSDRTHDLSRQLRSINAAIEAERESIHVLRAEWVYLANPARVEAEAKKHLTLRPTDPKQVIGLKGLSETMPTRAQATESVDVASAPLANVETTLMIPKSADPPSPKPIAATRTTAQKTIATVLADRSHINNRMIIGHAATKTASIQSRDTIGSLIHQLGARR